MQLILKKKVNFYTVQFLFLVLLHALGSVLLFLTLFTCSVLSYQLSKNKVIGLLEESDFLKVMLSKVSCRL